jgi:hypothetical protein
MAPLRNDATETDLHVDVASQRLLPPGAGRVLQDLPYADGECAACFVSGADALLVHVACEHRYCIGCLARLFRNVLVDRGLFPVRCCKIEIQTSLVDLCLEAKEAQLVTTRMLEMSTPPADRMWCSNTRCGAFISLFGIPTSERYNGAPFSCPTCKTQLCFTCKGPWHDPTALVSCADIERKRNESIDQPALTLARTMRWQRCPQCREMVELNMGCYHITCLCRFEFCYRCQAPWKTCPCPAFDEVNILHAVQERVRELRAAGEVVNANAIRVACVRYVLQRSR